MQLNSQLTIFDEALRALLDNVFINLEDLALNYM